MTRPPQPPPFGPQGPQGPPPGVPRPPVRPGPPMPPGPQGPMHPGPVQAPPRPPAYGPPPGMRAPAPPMHWGPPAYAVPPPMRPPVRHTSHTKLISFFCVGLLVAVGIFLLVGKLSTPAKKSYQCPPTCPQPPIGAPVNSMPRFTAADGSFSVEYYPANSKVSITKDASSITERITPNDTDKGAILFKGVAANGQTPVQVVTSFLRANFPDATQAYVLPNTFVGYQAGYGEIDDFYPQGGTGAFAHLRIVVLAAVRNGTAVIVAAAAPYHPFAPDGLNDGHPSGANVLLALLLDPLVNSVTWKGDSPR